MWFHIWYHHIAVGNSHPRQDSMSKGDRLYERAKSTTNNFSFSDLCQLAEHFGFVHDRTRGSHHIFIHPELRDQMDFQPKNGQAKPYQVRQLVKAIEDVKALQVEDSKGED
jgi:predicted RNA binding protein YcfA (HicA-like mRNA interferase family)